MEESTSREKVLKAIRDALVNPARVSYEAEDYADKIYASPDSAYIEVAFAEALARVNGKFVYNTSEQEFIENLMNLLKIRGTENLHCYEPDIQKLLNDNGIFCINSRDEFSESPLGITSCEFLVARTGSIMVSSRQPCGRKGFIYPALHIVVAYNDQLVFDIKDAFEAMKSRYADKGIPSMLSLITGPSRTADIEKTLVLGAHGPEELYVFFIDQPVLNVN